MCTWSAYSVRAQQLPSTCTKPSVGNNPTGRQVLAVSLVVSVALLLYTVGDCELYFCLLATEEKGQKKRQMQGSHVISLLFLALLL